MRKGGEVPVAQPIRRGSSSGFTLIELMAVLVIITILAVIAIISYSRHIKNSRLIDARAFVASIQAREEAYHQQYGIYYDASADGLGSGAGDVYYPALVAGEPVAKQWSSPLPVGWGNIGARPESGYSYFEFLVRASYPGAGAANHALHHDAGNLNIPDPTVSGLVVPWYYVIARGDLDGSGAACGAWPYPTCTVLTTTSVAGEIVTRNENN